MEKLVSSYTLYLLCLVSLAAGLTVQMPRAGSTGQFGDAPFRDRCLSESSFQWFSLIAMCLGLSASLSPLPPGIEGDA